MPHIQVMPKAVADMIAAGEVVERPASAAKELIENAIDAGAKNITVETRHGGVTYLRVTDDGCGIAAEEVPTAFLRHATSKIRVEEDLESIATLGFRGEALAALAAVANVTMLTKPREAEHGYTITIEAGQTLHQEEAGCPDGTTVVVRSLFFNVPARYKFLKRDAAEGAAVHAVVMREALSHPEIAFRFIRDGEQVLVTAGDDSMENVICAVLGRDFLRDGVLIRGSGENAAVTGYVTRPTACKGSRGSQYFFLNGRWIRSKLITAAVETAYRNQKMVGKFPGAVLYIACKFSAVDVNSHPTKTEVKFVRDKDIYDAVYYAVLQALGGEDDRPVLHLTPGGIALDEREVNPAAFRGTQLVFDSPGPALAKAAGTAREPSPWGKVAPEGPDEGNAADRTGVVQPIQFPSSVGSADSFPQGEAEDQTGHDVSLGAPGSSRPTQSGDEPDVGEGLAPPADEPAFRVTQVFEPEPAQTALEPPPEEVPWRVVGEAMNTYIIVEQGDALLFIDKHAAHERMNFDALKAQGARAMSQELLAPVVWRPDPQEGAALLDHAALLEEFGFQVGDFGGGQLTVGRVPHFITPEEAPEALSELARKLLTTGTLDPDAQRDELLHTMACKAAIKGGQKNGPQELLRVAQAVMSGQVKHCPHGRPVCTQLTRTQLERQFKRI